MSKPRVIALSNEQSEALKHFIKRGNGLTNNPVKRREKLADFVISTHGDWQGALEPLNSLQFNDLLYIATGGAWEVTKTVKETLEELCSDKRLDRLERDGVAFAIARLKERGLI
ncbi:hypothetical protein ANDROMEDA_60 [Bacillus phage Andromeda]|uniref:Uncharacterized protein n=2 Tax=Andromedavirus andromeda TaxID=1273739 RepID=M1IR24_9CAUD|nr:hypothetical protein I905_gp60 [Bacillus phage Andromeda]AGE60899.1 hypothetical protein GEMINI_60 [Bacillus phage Gemini]AGE61130.1 hypothetical protein ANDROMEDA_60 [Bacillus phage Andromeda]